MTRTRKIVAIGWGLVLAACITVCTALAGVLTGKLILEEEWGAAVIVFSLGILCIGLFMVTINAIIRIAGWPVEKR